MFHFHFVHISVIDTYCKLITIRYSTLTFFTFTKAAGNIKLSLSTTVGHVQLSPTTKAAENVKISLSTKSAGNVRLSFSTSAVAAATARADTLSTKVVGNVKLSLSTKEV